jgi:hypothetical protein
MSGCRKVREKCTFARLLPFNIGISAWMIPDFAAISGIYRALGRIARVIRRESMPPNRLLAAASLHPARVVFGDIVRHRRLTLQQRATADSHINCIKGKEIPELTTQSGFRRNGYLIAFG